MSNKELAAAKRARTTLRIGILHFNETVLAALGPFCWHFMYGEGLEHSKSRKAVFN